MLLVAVVSIRTLSYSTTFTFSFSTRWAIRLLRFYRIHTNHRLSENRFETYSSTSLFLLVKLGVIICRRGDLSRQKPDSFYQKTAPTDGFCAKGEI